MKKLFCSECNEEIIFCDECGRDFELGEEVICIDFSHFHRYCIPSGEVLEEEDLE